MHFGQIPRVPGDPILGLMDLYRADTNPAKLDLGVGVYKDAQGLTPIPRAVKLAEQRLVDSEQTKSYIGGHGDAQFGTLLLRQVLGSRAIALGEQRAGCTQAPGGTGALRLAGEQWAQPLATSELTVLMEQAAAREVPIMVFVGNRHCIQIHTGPVHNLRWMDSWFNEGFI